jgi:CheY-like chemotaxis protein
MMEPQLSSAGYQVSLARDGMAVVASYEAEGADLLFTNFSMPGMNGIRLTAKLQEPQPDLPAILLTGYTTEQVSWHQESQFHLIHKPVSQAQWFQEVASCLDRRRNFLPVLHDAEIEFGGRLVSMPFWCDPAVRNATRPKALDEDITVQVLIMEAFNMWFRARGKPRLAGCDGE